MSRLSGRSGPDRKWGGLQPTSIRWPVPHWEEYRRRADEAGMSLSEFVVRSMAELHELELVDNKPNEQQQQQQPLQLGA